MCPLRRRPWLEGPPSRLFGLRLVAESRLGPSWRHFPIAFSSSLAEVVHACGELAKACRELVVADDGRDGDYEAGGGGDEGF